MPGQSGEKTAQFARVAARLREQIAGGTLRLGQRLPPELELKETYGVSRGTIVRALDQLRAEGLIITVHGQGSEVASVPAVVQVRVGPADIATARLPDDREREALRMPPGVPLLVITRPGAPPELYDGAVTVIRGT